MRLPLLSPALKKLPGSLAGPADTEKETPPAASPGLASPQPGMPNGTKQRGGIFRLDTLSRSLNPAAAGSSASPPTLLQVTSAASGSASPASPHPRAANSAHALRSGTRQPPSTIAPTASDPLSIDAITQTNTAQRPVSNQSGLSPSPLRNPPSKQPPKQQKQPSNASAASRNAFLQPVPISQHAGDQATSSTKLGDDLSANASANVSSSNLCTTIITTSSTMSTRIDTILHTSGTLAESPENTISIDSPHVEPRVSTATGVSNRRRSNTINADVNKRVDVVGAGATGSVSQHQRRPRSTTTTAVPIGQSNGPMNIGTSIPLRVNGPGAASSGTPSTVNAAPVYQNPPPSNAAVPTTIESDHGSVRHAPQSPHPPVSVENGKIRSGHALSELRARKRNTIVDDAVSPIAFSVGSFVTNSSSIYAKTVQDTIDIVLPGSQGSTPSPKTLCNPPAAISLSTNSNFTAMSPRITPSSRPALNRQHAGDDTDYFSTRASEYSTAWQLHNSANSPNTSLNASLSASTAATSSSSPRSSTTQSRVSVTSAVMSPSVFNASMAAAASSELRQTTTTFRPDVMRLSDTMGAVPYRGRRQSIAASITNTPVITNEASQPMVGTSIGSKSPSRVSTTLSLGESADSGGDGVNSATPIASSTDINPSSHTLMQSRHHHRLTSISQDTRVTNHDKNVSIIIPQRLSTGVKVSTSASARSPTSPKPIGTKPPPSKSPTESQTLITSRGSTHLTTNTHVITTSPSTSSENLDPFPTDIETIEPIRDKPVSVSNAVLGMVIVNESELDTSVGVSPRSMPNPQHQKKKDSVDEPSKLPQQLEPHAPPPPLELNLLPPRMNSSRQRHAATGTPPSMLNASFSFTKSSRQADDVGVAAMPSPSVSGGGDVMSRSLGHRRLQSMDTIHVVAAPSQSSRKMKKHESDLDFNQVDDELRELSTTTTTTAAATTAMVASTTSMTAVATTDVKSGKQRVAPSMEELRAMRAENRSVLVSVFNWKRINTRGNYPARQHLHSPNPTTKTTIIPITTIAAAAFVDDSLLGREASSLPPMREEDAQDGTAAQSGFRKFSARKRWQVLSKCFKLGYRLSQLFRQSMRSIQATQNAHASDNAGLAFTLRSHQAHRDPALSLKVREALNPTHARAKEIIEPFERMLSIRLRSFARFTLNQRLQFCEIMSYERFPKETLLVKEGHRSLAFYFILNGQVEIFKIKENYKYRLNVLNSGDSFGDRTMNMLNDKRTACVATTMETELLRIDKTDFFKIANVMDEKNISHRIAQLLTIPFMASSDNGFIEKAVNFFKQITYEPNETILFEASDNLDLFWILEGTCRCVKMVPFVQKKTKKGYASTKSQLRPHEESVPLDQDEELIEHTLIVNELMSGDRFPDIPIDPSTHSNTLIESMFDVPKYIDFLSNLDPASKQTKAYVSVIANTKVEVMAIPRMDYCKLASARMILNLFRDQVHYRIPIPELQQSYMQQRNWQMFKKKVVGEVLKHK